MQARPILMSCLAAALLCAAPPRGAAQDDLSKVTIKTERLADGVAMLIGAGGNIGVSYGDDGVLLVDDQFAPLTPKIQTAVAALSPRPVRFVLNTHWHGDHIGGNENMGKAGAVVVAHENVRRRMAVGRAVQELRRAIPPAPKGALPVVTFTNEVTFHWNGDSIHVFHVHPAHTDGDAMVHWTRANVLHMGDVFFNGTYPFIDLASGGSIRGVISGVREALKLVNDRTKIIPGHGPVGDRAALQAYHDMLIGAYGAIEPLVRSKKTLEQVLAAKPTAKWDAQWSSDFVDGEALTRMVYQELSGAGAK